MNQLNTEQKCFESLGLDFNKLPDVSSFPEEDREYTLSNYILTKCIKAWVGDWVPDYGNPDQKKWANWIWVRRDSTNKTGFAFSVSRTNYVHTCTTSGARFAFPTYDMAKSFVNQFPQLYLNAHMVTVLKAA